MAEPRAGITFAKSPSVRVRRTVPEKEASAMASRPSWEGFLKFNLIAVPVKAYGATVSGGGKTGVQLPHQKCNSRFSYQQRCPIHGEVTKDGIVSAYEYAKGQYVTVEPEEIENLRTENDKTILPPPLTVAPYALTGTA